LKRRARKVFISIIFLCDRYHLFAKVSCCPSHFVHADQKTTLDLDDGVKVNYAKFGNLLAEVKAVTGKG
jgi:hypothetical protein